MEKIITIAENKKARFDYEIIETFEAGIVLFGSEVKSIRTWHANLRWSHVSIASGKPQAFGIQISGYKNATTITHIDPKRERSLLLKKKDIIRLSGKTKERGLTLVPLSIYLKGSLIKVEIGLVRGRAAHDKRNVLKNRVLTREAEYAIRARAH